MKKKQQQNGQLFTKITTFCVKTRITKIRSRFLKKCKQDYHYLI